MNEENVLEVGKLYVLNVDLTLFVDEVDELFIRTEKLPLDKDTVVFVLSNKVIPMGSDTVVLYVVLDSVNGRVGRLYSDLKTHTQHYTAL